MSKFKVGDKVKVINDKGMRCQRGSEHIVTVSLGGYVGLDGDLAPSWGEGRFELVEATTNKSDPVNNPSHYSEGMPDGVQVIDIIRAQEADFLHGNLIKYILRWKYKGGLQDLKKAKVYLDWLIAQEHAKSLTRIRTFTLSLVTSSALIDASCPTDWYS